MREPRYPLPRVVIDNERRPRIPHAHRVRGDGNGLLVKDSLARIAPGFVNARRRGRTRAGARDRHPTPHGVGGARARGPQAPRRKTQVRGSFCWAGFDNDPSAGSPTETLLRLLLPLNDKVQWTSRDVAGSEPPVSPRSEHFTGPFNR